ncbi:MAG TPA: HIT family protein [Ardenticatenaceae bacterium]|jgi:histidine triad (HIT) family protein
MAGGSGENCIFCKIVRGEIPSTRVHEDETSVTFLDLNQAAKGHLLIAPRAHAEQWHELNEETAAHLGKLAAQLAPAVLEGMQADGYNLLQNNGEAAGQEVMHVHLHLIPRWQGDRYFGGGPRHRNADARELQATAALIQNALANR